MPDEEPESYEANTVEELREELRARGLHTSGNKEELIARLEEDDASAEAEVTTDSTAVDTEVEAQVEEPPVADPWKTVYSPYELPISTVAAQQFADANPGSVDQAIDLGAERTVMAQANIQDHVDTMAAGGVTVEDPRLAGYVPGPSIASLSPPYVPVDQDVTITVNGSGFNDTSSVEIDQAGQTTTFVNAQTLTIDHQPTTAGTEMFTVRNGDNQESNNMPFNVIAA
jgi:hypothetical protein